MGFNEMECTGIHLSTMGISWDFMGIHGIWPLASSNVAG